MTALAVAAFAVSAVTFNKNVAPVVHKYCAPCHRPGESGPFPLLSYSDVRKRAPDIVRVTRKGYMPPWLPAPGPEFEGELRLSAAQIAMFEGWLKAGTPEGLRGDTPSAPHFTAGWQLGTPDLVLRMHESYALPADGPDVFRNFVLPVPVETVRYVRAVEIRPGDKRLVHHANLLVDRQRAARRLDAADPGPGFAGMDITLEANVFDPDSHFLFWKPGTPPRVESPEMTWRLDSETDLVMNLHLQPSGKPERIDAQVGLFFGDKPASRSPMLVQLEHDGALDIPPGQTKFAVTDSLTLPVDVDVIGVYPHAHYLGRQMQSWAVLPDGRRKTLVEIPDWDMNWQAVYYYRRPVELPRGTVVSMRWIYDNSASNERNPNHPPQRVRAGNNATDEMAHLWLQVLPKNGNDDRLAIQRSLMQARLRKYPGDFVAHFNLGAALLSEKKPEESIPHFRAALKSSPQSPAARTSLGAALESMGQVRAAMVEYRRAIDADPQYLDARYNLANLLAARREFSGAIEQYRAIRTHRPGDKSAAAKLSLVLQAEGDSLASAGRIPDAIARYREAADLTPDDADAHNNLGSALAVSGDLKQALGHFEAAVRIKPDHEQARNNLNLARSKLERRP